MKNKVYKLAEQEGIEAKEIVISLRMLGVKCLDPIYKQYPSMVVNKSRQLPLDEGFRIARDRGQAAVIQFTQVNYEMYTELAQWIRQNIPVSQLRIFYFSTSTNKKFSAAIGVAYGSTTNIPFVATVYDGVVVGPYLARYVPK